MSDGWILVFSQSWGQEGQEHRERSRRQGPSLGDPGKELEEQRQKTSRATDANQEHAARWRGRQWCLVMPDRKGGREWRGLCVNCGEAVNSLGSQAIVFGRMIQCASYSVCELRRRAVGK